MKRYSGVYKRGKKLFRYNFVNNVVEWVSKPGKDELADNAKWMAKYGKPLWDIVDGYIIVDAAGLREENWKRKAVRDEYLDEWIAEIDYECECEMELDFEFGVGSFA